jgi:hypothetical protein
MVSVAVRRLHARSTRNAGPASTGRSGWPWTTSASSTCGRTTRHRRPGGAPLRCRPAAEAGAHGAGDAHGTASKGLRPFAHAPPADGIVEVRRFGGPDDPRPTLVLAGRLACQGRADRLYAEAFDHPQRDGARGSTLALLLKFGRLASRFHPSAPSVCHRDLVQSTLTTFFSSRSFGNGRVTMN